MCKVALFFKRYKEEHARDYQQQDSSEEEEKEEVTRTSDDIELDIHCNLRGFWKYRKIWSPMSGQKLNIKHDKINLFDTYAMELFCENLKENLKSYFPWTSSSRSILVL